MAYINPIDGSISGTPAVDLTRVGDEAALLWETLGKPSLILRPRDNLFYERERFGDAQLKKHLSFKDAMTAFTRSSKRRDDAATGLQGALVGPFVEAANDLPCISRAGLRLGGAVTNYIRNALFEGASGATPPPNWSVAMAGLTVTYTIITFMGWPALRVDVSAGTANGSSTQILFESPTQIVSTPTNPFTGGVALALVSGVWPGSPVLRMQGRNTGGSLLGETTQAVTYSDSNLRRYSATRTMAVSEDRASFGIGFGALSGAVTAFSFVVVAPTCTQTPFDPGPIFPAAGAPGNSSAVADAFYRSTGDWCNPNTAFAAVSIMEVGGLSGVSFSPGPIFSDGSSNNAVSLGVNNVNGTLFGSAREGGAANMSISNGTFSAAAGDKVALAMAFNGTTLTWAAKVKGDAIVNGSGAASLSGLDRFSPCGGSTMTYGGGPARLIESMVWPEAKDATFLENLVNRVEYV
jgi:hypothetical protein